MFLLLLYNLLKKNIVACIQCYNMVDFKIWRELRKPCPGKEGGVHEQHGEGLVCQELDLRVGSGLDEVGRSFARWLVNP